MKVRGTMFWQHFQSSPCCCQDRVRGMHEGSRNWLLESSCSWKWWCGTSGFSTSCPMIVWMRRTLEAIFFCENICRHNYKTVSAPWCIFQGIQIFTESARKTCLFKIKSYREIHESHVQWLFFALHFSCSCQTEKRLSVMPLAGQKQHWDLVGKNTIFLIVYRREVSIYFPLSTLSFV